MRYSGGLDLLSRSELNAARRDVGCSPPRITPDLTLLRTRAYGPDIQG